MFSAIRKLVVAVVGLGLIVLHNQVGVDLTGVQDGLVEIVLAGLTAAGVYAVPNEPAD